jgi:hypothetical protein
LDRPASKSYPGRIILCTAYDLSGPAGRESGVILSGLDHEGPPGRLDMWSGGVRSQLGTEPRQPASERISMPDHAPAPAGRRIALIAHDNKSCSRRPRPVTSCSSSSGSRSPASAAAPTAATSKSAPASPRARSICWCSCGIRWSHIPMTRTSRPCSGSPLSAISRLPATGQPQIS